MTKIKEIIQSFFSSGTLTVIGSGLSCSEGMPGMKALSDELITKIPKLLSSKNKIWDSIKTCLENSEGLEETLLKHKPDFKLEELISKVTYQFIIEKEKQILLELFTSNRRLKFEKFINRMPLTSTGLPIITTNYDRLIEFACEKNKIYTDTLFLGKYYSTLDAKGSRYSFCKGIKKVKTAYFAEYQKRIKIYKPHGCLSWHLVNGEPISTNLDIDSQNLIITPGLNKYRAGYDKPFDIHREYANKEIDKANRFIIIGYGFNDDHLETHLKAQILSGKQTLIITFKLSPQARLLSKYENVIAVESDDNCRDSIIFANGKKHEIKNNQIWDLEFFIKEMFNER